MPNIRTYDARNVDLQPDERGMQALGREASALGSEADSTVDLGRAQAGKAAAGAATLGMVGNVLGNGIKDVGEAYVKYQTNKQISAGAPSLVGIQGDLNNVWDATRNAADPNDTSIAPGFLEKDVEPTLQKFVDGFDTEEGQKWAQSQTNSLRQHFYEKTAADEATRAGQAAKMNLDVLKNRATNNVLNDPTSLNATLGLVGNSVDAIIASNPHLDPATVNSLRTDLGQQIKSEIVKGAAVGFVQKNPAAAIDLIKSGKFSDYLDANESEGLIKGAEALIRAQSEQERLASAEQKRANQTAAASAQNQLVTSLVQPDGSLQFPPDFYKRAFAVAQMPDAPAGMGESLISFGMAKAKELERPAPIYTDPATYADFGERVNLPDTDPRHLTTSQILDARSMGDLNDEDFKHFVGIANKSTTDKAAQKDFGNFLNSNKAFITKSTFLKPEAFGEQKFYEFKANAQLLHDRLAAEKIPEETIRQQIMRTIPQFAITQGMALGAIKNQARGTLVPLPRVGEVRNGRPFLGGDPALPASWGPRK